MTIPSQVQQHPASVDAYIRHGWSLVPIPFGTKGPSNKGWNLKDSALKSQAELAPGYGIGLAHAYSGTMALDIDSWPLASTMLHASGISLDELYTAPDAVVIDSGKQGHGKLLYRMPFGLALPSKKILQGKVTVYELRCATANGLTVQDVLPPSIHPETMQPYRWAGLGHWSRLPMIPQTILDLWQSMLDLDKQRTIGTGEAGVDASWEEIRGALEHINPDCSREEWINCGMALHWAGTQTDQLEQALQLWNEWSSPSVKYPGERQILTQWASFKTDKSNSVKLGTLFHYARKSGWVRPAIDVAGLFKPTTEVVEPARLTMSFRPAPPDLNTELFPKILADRANEIGDSVGCDPLVPLFAGLAAVCGAIDARTRLELMPGFKVPPVLWLMTIGEPADKKSPGSRPMFNILKQIENEDRARYSKEQLQFEADEARYITAKKSFIEHMQSPEALLDNTVMPTVPPAPKAPTAVKITVQDITSQKLVRQAADRPRGLLCYLDEMNSWVDKITDSRSGEDRSAWVVAYESEWYEMDRVGAGTIYCENFALSIFGNIQPRVFSNNVESLSKDGLVQRFIPIVLRSDKTKLGNPVPDSLTQRAAYDQVIRVVYGLPAMTYRLSDDAFQVYREFQGWYEQAKRDERMIRSSDTFMTAFGKLEGLVGRLALVFHVIEEPYSLSVSADLMRRVIDFVKGYVIPVLRYTHDGDLGGVSSFDQWLADHIIHNSNAASITMTEIKHSARRQLKGMNTWSADQMVIGGMMSLEQAGWVLRTDDRSQEHRHIAEWAINPSLFENFKAYRKQVMQAKQRQLDVIYKLSTKGVPRVKGIDDETGEIL
jgi:hypothetical protein